MKAPASALAGALCAALAAGCSSLPDPASMPTSPGLDRVYHSASVAVNQRPGFDPAHFDGARIDSIHVDPPAAAREEELAAYTALAKAFEEAVAASPAGHAPATPSTARVELVVKDVRLVDPALNVVSAVALLVPLDTGAMTVEASFRDARGVVVAQRIERVNGSPLDIANALSRSGRLEKAARAWVTSCAAWPTCALPPRDPR